MADITCLQRLYLNNIHRILCQNSLPSRYLAGIFRYTFLSEMTRYGRLLVVPCLTTVPLWRHAILLVICVGNPLVTQNTLMFLVMLAWTGCWRNSRVAGGFRRNEAHKTSLKCFGSLCRNKSAINSIWLKLFSGKWFGKVLYLSAIVS